MGTLEKSQLSHDPTHIGIHALQQALPLSFAFFRKGQGQVDTRNPGSASAQTSHEATTGRTPRNGSFGREIAEARP